MPSHDLVAQAHAGEPTVNGRAAHGVRILADAPNRARITKWRCVPNYMYLVNTARDTFRALKDWASKGTLQVDGIHDACERKGEARSFVGRVLRREC